MGNGTGLGRVRGLGSAKHGGNHWVLHRMTAVSNLLLMLWLIFSLLRLPTYDYATIRLWLEQPLVAVPMMLTVISIFWHFRIGLQVLIEDYVHEDGLKFASLAALSFYTFGLGALALFSIAKIALTGTPN
ncbi:MAG: succinate dehydrogenase, hydrophobic membrane anchor protein [Sphingomonadaceae bacterium]|jgi:succinate dehydrogenase / fumarate reductase membrane anchor subunit|nr:succinate dehydrogenase, hydrophobic membrane anchor protein [Sphingomonadaceae bacterium]NBU79203.1 succinate dehydrogenase, hydrophobic membrane anchor protein [Sphingomonadaceae bacterium]NCA01526.1 succinate dehydrogenase, hydrophobic membrane anchor protein [Sphingomonadaceae bacterium]